MTNGWSCIVVGAGSLTVQCAQALLDRGHRITQLVSGADDIRRWAAKQEIPSYENANKLLAAAPESVDYVFSIANLSVLSDDVLALSKETPINFHDGPLPRYAGLNAPAWALLHGESRHGVTWHEISGDLDEGRILSQSEFDIELADSALTLNTKCYDHGYRSFVSLIEAMAQGNVEAKEQDLSARSYFGKSDRPSAGATLDFGQPAASVDRVIRALDFGEGYENPLGLPKVLAGDALRLVGGCELLADKTDAQPGAVLRCAADACEIATGEGVVRLSGFRDFGGRALSADEALGTTRELTSPSETLTERFKSFDQDFVKYEGFWGRRLARAGSFALPLVRHGAKGSPRFLKVGLPAGCDALTMITAYLARISDQTDFFVRYRDASTARARTGLEAWLSPEVPLRIRAAYDKPFFAWREQLAKERQRIAERGTYHRDLPLRDTSASQGLGRIPVRIVVGELRSDPALIDGVDLAFGVDDDQLIIAAPLAALDESHGDQLVAQIEQFARNAHEDAEQALSAVGLLSQAERDTLARFNKTTVSIDGPQLIHELFAEQAARTPDAVAVIAGAKQLSYRELDQQANRLAHHLVEQGVGPDTFVGVATERSTEMLVALLAVLKAGGAYVPIDPAYPLERLRLMIADSGLKILLTQASVLPRLPVHEATTICVDNDKEQFQTQRDDAPKIAITPEHLAYVIYTSGSTGKPKGVMVEHRNVANFFRGMDDCIKYDKAGQNTWLAVTSLSFDISVLELFWTLCRGFKVVLRQEDDWKQATSEPTRPVSFSLLYFASDEAEQGVRNKYQLLLDGARFADENGFVAVWTPERHFHAFGGLYPNPSVVSAAIAAITERIQIRSGSCVVPLHHPIRVAEEWSVVDNLSGGRVAIGFASGWQPNDFVLQPQNFENRHQVMTESIDTIRRLWRGETVAFPDANGEPVDVKLLPNPVQAELPFWLTAAGNPKTFQLAGSAGANLLTHLLGQTVEELAEKIKIYRDARREAGHPGEGTVTLMLHTLVGESDEQVKERVRGPMTDYLRSSVNLVKKFAWSFPAFKNRPKQGDGGVDLEALTPEEIEAILDHSFERYFETSGLFGTVDRCAAMVESVCAVGVDEIAALIDYGVPSDTVRQHFPYLNQLRARMTAAATPVAQQETIADLIVKHKVSHMQCTPSMATMMLTDPSNHDAIAGLECLLIGGEAFPPGLARELRRTLSDGASLINMYGPTETTIWSSVHTVEHAGATIPIGQPIANTTLHVLDRALSPVAIGGVGELYIGGAGVVRGYHKRDDLTAERFITAPSGERLYRTGDLARLRTDGVLEFLGRVDHQVKLRGYRIELGEIESRLVEQDAIREAVVVAREDSPGDKRLVAYVVAEQRNIDEGAVREALRANLPEFMIPAHVVPLDRFPLTPNSKIDRKALPPPGVQVRRETAFVAPESPLEQQIAEVWCDVLAIKQCGLDDNFFDLGGHSLLAVQAHVGLKQKLERELSLTDLFRFPTVRALSTHLQGGGEEAAEVDAARQRAKTRRSSLAARRRRRR